MTALSHPHRMQHDPVVMDALALESWLRLRPKWAAQSGVTYKASPPA